MYLFIPFFRPLCHRPSTRAQSTLRGLNSELPCVLWLTGGSLHLSVPHCRPCESHLRCWRCLCRSLNNENNPIANHSVNDKWPRQPKRPLSCRTLDSVGRELRGIIKPRAEQLLGDTCVIDRQLTCNMTKRFSTRPKQGDILASTSASRARCWLDTSGPLAFLGEVVAVRYGCTLVRGVVVLSPTCTSYTLLTRISVYPAHHEVTHISARPQHAP